MEQESTSERRAVNNKADMHLHNTDPLIFWSFMRKDKERTLRTEGAWGHCGRKWETMSRVRHSTVFCGVFKSPVQNFCVKATVQKAQ